MKARIAKKIIKIWCKGCDKRFFLCSPLQKGCFEKK